jgi:hypothetical protein
VNEKSEKRRKSSKCVLDLARIMTPLPDVDDDIFIRTFERNGSHFVFENNGERRS